jgi:hypothetical protein
MSGLLAKRLLDDGWWIDHRMGQRLMIRMCIVLLPVKRLIGEGWVIDHYLGQRLLIRMCIILLPVRNLIGEGWRVHHHTYIYHAKQTQPKFIARKCIVFLFKQ